MIVPAYVIDQETGETLGMFGIEQGPEEYLAHRWMLARRYTVPAVGPGGHSWPAWIGALCMLLCTFAVLLQGWR